MLSTVNARDACLVVVDGGGEGEGGGESPGVNTGHMVIHTVKTGAISALQLIVRGC